MPNEVERPESVILSGWAWNDSADCRSVDPANAEASIREAEAYRKLQDCRDLYRRMILTIRHKVYAREYISRFASIKTKASHKKKQSLLFLRRS